MLLLNVLMVSSGTVCTLQCSHRGRVTEWVGWGCVSGVGDKVSGGSEQTITFLRKSFSTQIARIVVIFVMRAHVCMHITFLRECLGTNGTRERLLFGVNRTNVGLEIACVRGEQMDSS